MRLILLLFISFSFTTININAQNERAGSYKLHIKQSAYSNVKPVTLILEEEFTKTETYFKLDGKEATRTVKYFQEIDSSFSLDNIYRNPAPRSIKVEVVQEDDKLIIKPSDIISRLLNKYQNKSNKRLVLDISKEVKLTKSTGTVGVMTMPLKVYLFNRSSKQEFTNNVENNLNIALTVGAGSKKYSFKSGRAPILTNKTYAFMFAGVNRLNLIPTNTDSIHVDNTILSFSFGTGAQWTIKNLGINILLGLDMPTSEFANDWIFRYQPWLGVGLAYSVF